VAVNEPAPPAAPPRHLSIVPPPAPDERLHARVLTSSEEVAALRPDWDALVERCAASAFLSGTFFIAWLEEMGAGSAPFVVAVEEADGRLRGICPWARRGALAFSVPGRFRVAGELLAAPGDLETVWRIGLRAALRRRRVRAVVVPWLPAGPQVEAATAACQELRLAHRALARYRRWLQPLAGTFDEYHSGLSTRRRRALRNGRNKLEREGEVVFRDVAYDDALPTLRAFFARQWDPRLRMDVIWLDSAEGSAIDRRVLERFAHEVVLLEVGGRAVAGAVTVSCGDYRTFLYLVRDPDVSAASPGETLNLELIRRAYADGVRVFDHMGEGGRKDWQGVAPTQGYELVVTRRGPLGAALLAARGAQVARSERGLVD